MGYCWIKEGAYLKKTIPIIQICVNRFNQRESMSNGIKIFYQLEEFKEEVKLPDKSIVRKIINC